MCGIAGLYHLAGGALDPLRVRAAADLMQHRGPGGDGYVLVHTASAAWAERRGDDTPAAIAQPHLAALTTLDDGTAPDLVLAHRRLAIIDLSPGGHEPMTVRTAEGIAGQYWITFNGEIYNFLELRDELRGMGYRFHTESDVEVLVTAYHAWGSACLHRCFGMFAFALWDAPNRRLFCARDRFGVKPFYYAVHDGEFAFASEIKAVRSLLPACGEPDLAYVFAFLHSGRAVDAPRTPFARIHELPGGCTLTIEHGVVGQPVRWYDIDLERARASYDYDRPEAELLRLMHDSVRLRLRADVPVGTCLSGGLDSSGIVALATAQLRETLGPEARMNSFSAVYPVAGMDESRYVDLVAETYRTIAHRVTPTSDAFLDQLARITWHQDIPTGTSGVYTQHFVMQLAQGRVTVLLDGQGADELFGGYLSYVVVHLDALRRTRPAQYAREMAAFMAGVWGRFNASLNWREFGDRVLRYVTRRPAASVLAGEPAAIGAVRAREVYNDGLPYGVTAPVGSDALNRHLYRALMRESIPALLHYEDRNSMAYSIEARVPYLDHRLAEFALGLPAAHKIRAPETKRVMRRAFAEVLPPAITQRKDKLGYPTPLAQWLRGPLRQPVHDYLHEQVLRRGWYDADAVRGLWAAHTAARANHERAIYRMLTAEMWMQQAERPASLAVAGHALPIG